MTMHPVQSTSIRSVGYDPESKTLRLQFRASSNLYDFANVSTEQHKAMLEAESIGRHFGLHIQPKHKATKVKP